MLAAAAAVLLASAAPLVVHLRVRVALCPGPDGTPVPAVPAASIDEQLADLVTILGPHGITITAERDSFSPPHCTLLTRQERDDFASQVPAPDGTVTVLVVPLIRDLGVLTYNLRGVHWRVGKRDWVFLTARAHGPALAHELCHHFGLPHDPRGGTLMTPGPSSPAWRSAHPPRPFAPILDDGQVQRLREGIARRTSGAATLQGPATDCAGPTIENSSDRPRNRAVREQGRGAKAPFRSWNAHC